MKFLIKVMLIISIITFAINTAKAQYSDVWIENVSWAKPVLSTESTELKLEFMYSGYMPDSLYTLTIEWSVDAGPVNTINWTGELESYMTEEITLGSYLFTPKTGDMPYNLNVTISNPNGMPDDYPNDNTVWMDVFPAIQTGTYSIGSDPSDDYPELGELFNMISGGGIEGDGDLVLNVRPGTYYDQVELDDPNQSGDIIIRRMPGQTGDVVFEQIFSSEDYYTSAYENGPKGNFAFSFDYVDNLILDGINFVVVVDTTTDMYGGGYVDGQILRVRGTSFLEINNCTFEFVIDDLNNQISYYLRNIMIEESHDIIFTNNSVTGLENPQYPWDMILLEFINSTNIDVMYNGFYFGGIGVNEDNYDVCDRVITVTDNEFRGMVGFGANLNFTPGQNNPECPNPTSDVTVSNNILDFTDYVPPTTQFFGLCIYNGSTVSGNSFSGFKGNGGDSQAVVFLDHTDDRLDDEVEVSDNDISGSEDIVGIKLNNIGSGSIGNNSLTITNTRSDFTNSGILVANSGSDDHLWIDRNEMETKNADGLRLVNTRTKMYYNSIKTDSDNPADNNAGFKSDGSVGYIANNRVTGDDAHGMMFTNPGSTDTDPDGLFLCYNSIGMDADNNTSIYVDGGSNQGLNFRRNMVMNFGNGASMYADNVTGNPLNSDENNLRTNGTDLAYFEGQWNADLAAWQTASGQDPRSASVDVELEDDGSMIPVEFNEYLFHTDPLFDTNNPIFAECEQFDFKGNERKDNFFVGFNAPEVKVNIINQPEDIIGCYGSEAFTGVVANLDSDMDPTYTWFKDGKQILNYGLNGIGFAELKYSMEGVYYCIVSGLGVQNPVKTEEFVVKVLHKPEIMIQPKPQMLDLGEKAVFEVEANVIGNLPPYYRTQIQWYKGAVQLVDNDRVSGSKSSRLTIMNIEAGDYDDYWVKIAGRCGNVDSELAPMSPKPSLNFTAQPMDAEMCKGSDFYFMVGAEGTNGGTIKSYQWYIDGAMADENMYGGTTSATLTGTADQNLTNVTCKVMISPGDFEFDSDMASLTVHSGPMFSSDLAATDDKKEGETFTATVEATGFGTMSYKWFSSVDASLDETSSTLTIEDLLESHTGDYWCEVTDDCGTTSSATMTLTVTKSEIQTSVLEDYMNEFLISPNPFNTNTTISYELKDFADVKIVVNDMQGNEILFLNQGRLAPSFYTYTFNGEDRRLESGTYLCTVIINGESFTRKMMFVK